MPRNKRPTKTVRINLEVRTIFKSQVKRVQDMTNSESLTETLRKSVSVHEALLIAVGNKSKLIIRDQDGSETQVILVP